MSNSVERVTDKNFRLVPARATDYFTAAVKHGTELECGGEDEARKSLARRVAATISSMSVSELL
jgi:hypothetical protein